MPMSSVVKKMTGSKHLRWEILVEKPVQRSEFSLVFAQIYIYTDMPRVPLHIDSALLSYSEVEKKPLFSVPSLDEERHEDFSFIHGNFW